MIPRHSYALAGIMLGFFAYFGGFLLGADRNSRRIGLASYYDSEKYAGRPTASGEPYDPRAFTAASWEFYGRWVIVRNLETGAAVRVRVNDRGPAKRLVEQGRIIDLSEAAFKTIAPLSQGVVRVEVVNQ